MILKLVSAIGLGLLVFFALIGLNAFEGPHLAIPWSAKPTTAPFSAVYHGVPANWSR